MTEEMMRQLASTGVVGVLLVLTLLALRDKDRKLTAEMNARIEDANKFNDRAMALQREVIAAVNQLAEMLDIWERREQAKPATRATEVRR